MARWTGQGQEGLTLRVVADAEGILHSPHLHQGRHMGRQACRQAEVTGAFERCEVDSCEQAPQQAGATAQQQLLAGSQCWAGTRRLAGQQMQLGGGSRAGTLSAFRGSHHPSAAAAAALLLGLAATATAGAFWAAALKKIRGAQTVAPASAGARGQRYISVHEQNVHAMQKHAQAIGQRQSRAGTCAAARRAANHAASAVNRAALWQIESHRAGLPPCSRQASRNVSQAGSKPAGQAAKHPASQPACAAWLAEPYTWVLHPLPAKP